MKKNVTIFIFLLFFVLCFTGCSNSKLITKNLTITGTIYGQSCDNGIRGKCIENYNIFPDGFTFHHNDYNQVRPYLNKTVTIKGNLISEINVYSCEEDYNDGLQHPINNICKYPQVKYYEATKYFDIETIEIKE